MAAIAKSLAHFIIAALTVGSGGSKIKKIKKGSVTVNPASIAAGAVGETTVTITGVQVGDLVQLIPPTTLEAGLVIGQPFVSAADTVKFRMINGTGGAVDAASGSWTYVWVSF